MVVTAGRPPGQQAASSLAAARALAADRASAWYPELTGPVLVEPVVLAARPRCTLVDVRLAAGGLQRRVVVKMRTDVVVGGPERPTLVPDRVPAVEQAAAEFAGLSHVAEALDPADPCHAAIRPVEHVAGTATLVMEHVDAPTLRSALLAASRLPAVSRARGSAPIHRSDTTAYRNAGSWLARFHEWDGPPGASDRLATRADVLERFDAYGRHLTAVPGGAPAARIARAGAALAADALPERLHLAAGHGDFAPRNVFVGPGGRVAVFDPMPRWRAPVLEDLCRFLVGVRLLGLQVHSQGLAYSARWLDAVERDVLAGYFGADVPTGELAALRTLVLLDKWAALATGGGAGPRGAVVRARAAWAGRHLAREADRVLRAAA